MATNYARWDAWDPDQAEAEANIRDECAAAAARLSSLTSTVQRDLHRRTESAKETAETLEAHAAVAALLSKTGGAGRRRRDRTGATAEPPIEPAITITNREQCQAAVAPEHCPSPALIFARKILELSTAVADVADEVRNADNSLRNSGPDASSAFLRSSASLLARVAQVLRACTEAEGSWAEEPRDHAAPPVVMKETETGGNTTSFDKDRFERSLRDLTITMRSLQVEAYLKVSRAALSRGEMALAIDAARSCIDANRSIAYAPSKTDMMSDKKKVDSMKQAGQEAEAASFIIRGLAFVAVGSLFLAAQNLRNARMINKSYPGLEDFYKDVETHLYQDAIYFDTHRDNLEALVYEVMQWYQMISVDSECSTAPENHSSLQSICPDLISLPFLKVSEISPKFKYSQRQGRRSIEASGSLDVEVSSNNETKTTSEIGISPVELSAVFRSNTSDRLGALRRCFYDAQTLYVESQMKSAETRYIAFLWAALAVASDVDIDDQVRCTLLSHASAALINAAVCRASRTAHKHSARHAQPSCIPSADASNISIPPLDSLDLRNLCTCDPEELMNIARGLVQHLSSRNSSLAVNTEPDMVILSTDEVMIDIKLSLVQEILGRYSRAFESTSIALQSISEYSRSSLQLRDQDGETSRHARLATRVLKLPRGRAGLNASLLLFDHSMCLDGMSNDPVSLATEEVDDVCNRLRKRQTRLTNMLESHGDN